MLPGVPDYLSVGTHQARQNNWTEELRFTSNDDEKSRWSWVAGLYYQHNISADKQQFAEPFDEVANYLSEYYGYGPGNSLSYFGEAPVDGKFSYIDNFTVRETDKAAYGNVSYEILDGLKAGRGLARGPERLRLHRLPGRALRHGRRRRPIAARRRRRRSHRASTSPTSSPPTR